MCAIYCISSHVWTHMPYVPGILASFSFPAACLCTCLGCSHFCTHHTPTEMARQIQDHFICKAFSSGKLAIVFSVLAIICTLVITLVSHIVIYTPVPDLYCRAGSGKKKAVGTVWLPSGRSWPGTELGEGKAKGRRGGGICMPLQM